MPAKLKIAVEEKIFLGLDTEDDPDQDTYVVIRQASQAETEKRTELTAEASRVFRTIDSRTEVEVKQRWSIEEQKKLEVFLTLVGCNITVGGENEGEKERPLFRFSKSGSRSILAMSEEEFNEAWGRLPTHWATKIHDAVLKVNQDWDPNSRS